MAESSAYLPAESVRYACGEILNDIGLARAKLELTLAEKYRDRGWWRPRRSIAEATLMLNQDEQEIVALHRAQEFRRVANLMRLATAAAHEFPGNTIFVSAKDYALIDKFYRICPAPGGWVYVDRLENVS